MCVRMCVCVSDIGVQGRVRWLAAGPACASVRELSAQPSRDRLWWRRLRGSRKVSKGRPIAREGDRAKREEKKKKEGQRYRRVGGR